jgi:hypothetical protein
MLFDRGIDNTYESTHIKSFNSQYNITLCNEKTHKVTLVLIEANLI